MRHFLWTAFGVVLVIAAWLVWAASTREAHWTGGFDLQVHIVSERPLRSLKCQTFMSVTEAEAVSTRMDMIDAVGTSAVAVPFQGAPLNVRVYVSGIGDRYRRQEHGLLLWAELENGELIYRTVEIPDGRISRTLSVDLR